MCKVKNKINLNKQYLSMGFVPRKLLVSESVVILISGVFLLIDSVEKLLFFFSSIANSEPYFG